ncbi:MAG: hypothetical protein ACMG6S_27020, partial [Byssovorax sp.]
GVRFQYEYEANTGRCKKTWGPKGLYAIELSVDKAARTTLIEGEEPRIITWNDQGLALRATMLDGTILEERAYDDDGLLIAKVNGAGEGEQYWYDERGNQIRVVDATGGVTSIEYEDDLEMRRTGPDGLVTELTHDDRGALTHVVHPSGMSYAMSYDARGRIIAIHRSGVRIQSLEHSARHEVIAETDAVGARTTYAHDELGRPVARTDALGRVTRATYDRLGRVIGLRFNDGSTVHRAYDAQGNMVRETDQLGHVTVMEYAGMGVLTRLTQPDGQAWTLAYTSMERLREIKNPLGESYSFVLDDAARIVEERPFDGRKLAYRWSAAGRLDRIDYPDGSFRSFGYDRAGRMVGDEGSDGSVITYQRDRMGRLTAAFLEAQGVRSSTFFERDALGRVTSERQGDRAIRYTHDAEGRRASRTLPNGTVTRYAYDALDTMIGVEHAGQALTIERDVLGRETRMSVADGKVLIFSSYDAMDRLVENRVMAPSPGAAVPVALVQRQWQYDRAGKVTRIEDSRWQSTAYRYDTSGQLAEATRGSQRAIFEHDPAGSLVRALVSLGGNEPTSAPEPRGKARDRWKVARGNLLLQTAQTKYAYDERGRRIGKLTAEPDGKEALTEYVWDCRDRLREVKHPDGARVVMSYDALGRRARKEIFAVNGGRSRSVDFFWDGDALCADFDSERGARSFVFRPETLEPLLQEERGEVLAYVNDHLGMPKELIDPAGM